MTSGIIVVNAGSTSLKFGVYSIGNGSEPQRVCRGGVDQMAANPLFSAIDSEDKILGEHSWGENNPIGHEEALSFVIKWTQSSIEDIKLIGAGHRIVLGGTRFEAPAIIDDEVLSYLDSLSAMEPSHQPYNVAGARVIAKAFGKMHQVGCFDTSFHRTMPEVSEIYAVPKELSDLGVRHWGYHGLSYDYISRKLKKIMPEARRVIAAHLGGGCSICAIKDGKSIDTSMGFAGLSGLPMATRTGDLPPEIVFYLMRQGSYTLDSLENVLYKKSGLLGLSGISEDMKTLLESELAGAKKAIDYFVYQIVKYVGAYAASLGGLDALVFTAGIGEKAMQIRKAVSDKLQFLGVELDESRNASNEMLISADSSKISVFAIPTNEELMIAIHTTNVLKTNDLI